MQSRLDSADLAVLLALVRAGNLARAGELMGFDASTVFRAVKRIERTLGQRLFERSRAGYRATELGLALAQHAERIEAELEAARTAARGDEVSAVSGKVRISTTDTILYGIVLPALPGLMAANPHLKLEINANNDLANLTQRDADLALRATKRPPQHLLGRALGPIRVALFAPQSMARATRRRIDPDAAPWISVDDALPEHPSVLWRRKCHPEVVPRILVNSVQSVFEGICAGCGIGIVPLFLAGTRRDLVAISDPLDEAETQLWLLTHPESRHLRRIATVATYLAEAITLC
jgi:DNA-binding transcriptional LysR family regulator